jgi:hypothetical protein
MHWDRCTLPNITANIGTRSAAAQHSIHNFNFNRQHRAARRTMEGRVLM